MASSKEGSPELPASPSITKAQRKKDKAAKREKKGIELIPTTYLPVYLLTFRTSS
jgi:hypothetical protein